MLNEEWMLHVISMLMLWNEIANYLVLNGVERMLHINLNADPCGIKCKLTHTECCGTDAAYYLNAGSEGINVNHLVLKRCAE